MKEFEAVLLKKITHSSEFFSKALPIVKPKYFMDIGNQELFGLVQAYFQEYRDMPSLTELVASVKNVSNAEMRAQIIGSLQAVANTEEVQNLDFMLDETVKWVKDMMYYESLQLGADGMTKKDDGLKLQAQAIMDERAKVTIDTDLGLDFDDIDEMIAYYSERKVGIRTQHPEFNKRLGPGFLPGTLSVILAAGGVGKSLLMTDLISGMIKKGRNILIVSLEMADKEVMKRVHANAMDLPINSLLDLSKTPGELRKLERSVIDKQQVLDAYQKMKLSGTCGRLFVKDYPSNSFSALMLEQLVESYRIERGVEFDIVFVDYLGIMKSDLISPSAGLYSYIKSIGEEVRASAKKMKIPVVSASQLNRGVYKQEAKDVDNSSISDSLGTSMTADFMLFLLQNEEMKQKKEMVCKVTKNRFNGRTDTWLMGIDYEKMRFHELLVQVPGVTGAEIPIKTGGPAALTDDFGVVTPQKQKKAEEFATQEIGDIAREDQVKVHSSDAQNDLDDLYKDLGI